MRLTYELNRWDLWKASLTTLQRQRIFPIFLLAIAAFVWWSSFNYKGSLDRSVAFRAGAATITSIFYLFVILTAVAGLIAVLTVIRKHKGVLGRHTLEITEAGPPRDHRVQ
jgi:hypothetical protein